MFFFFISLTESLLVLWHYMYGRGHCSCLQREADYKVMFFLSIVNFFCTPVYITNMFAVPSQPLYVTNQTQSPVEYRMTCEGFQCIASSSID